MRPAVLAVPHLVESLTHSLRVLVSILLPLLVVHRVELEVESPSFLDPIVDNKGFVASYTSMSATQGAP